MIMISKKLFPIIILIHFFQYASERNLNYFNFYKFSKKNVLMHRPSIKKSLLQYTDTASLQSLNLGLICLFICLNGQIERQKEIETILESKKTCIEKYRFAGIFGYEFFKILVLTVLEETGQAITTYSIYPFDIQRIFRQTTLKFYFIVSVTFF